VSVASILNISASIWVETKAAPRTGRRPSMCSVDGELGSGPSRANAWGRFSCGFCEGWPGSTIETGRQLRVAIHVVFERVVVALKGAECGTVRVIVGHGGRLLGEPKPILIHADGCLDVNAPMKLITYAADAQPNTPLGTIRRENRDGIFKVSSGYDLLPHKSPDIGGYRCSRRL
jgi:hypothetical protein